MSSPSTATTIATPARLHGFALSGHVHRVRLLLSLLGLPWEERELDLRQGEQRRPEFLALNPLGQVPVLEIDGQVLSDSNAILVYLALRHDPRRQWLPESPVLQAAVQRWLSLAAGPLAHGPAAARAAALFGRPPVPQAPALAERLFGAMEQQLARQPWLAAPHPTLADLALYAYTARAPEGGLPLAPYGHIRRWLAAVEALPGFVPMPVAPGLEALS
ncbi:glutathione S-transferase family protein [Pelomonas sp. BJYL3]|uniref:glutathione S-transferase family protein n=1 Tax=Pelomonas sp. BJYL3 TaxID=2976697 RepID=UPI0022B36FBB|nr:glutathione S-transferase [Pelomonas sp. BJYL3]